MKNIIAFIISLLLGFAAGTLLHSPTETVRTRVLVRRDTIKILQPAPVAERPVATVAARLPSTVVHDTVEVFVPIVQKVYEGPDYRAFVSGYRPSLDSIVITATHTEIMKPATKPRRWNIGLQAGYGITPGGLQPYIGIGVSYRIL